MSTYKDFLDEKAKIDALVEKGYVISKVTEHLDGTDVAFEKNEDLKEILQIRHADARKYFSSIILKQQSMINN
ncbi:hypothetical protein EV207_11876 [Scopulibacillus darangshiensis]|uniref:Uncharacterized protein n=1 Tax=Scopulibacillus darangshiensis TaxID=442528 RepID=A0A4R2NZB9_9BACL|nr:hypothetical protein [Scopulibacillus darangshiensis]TCP27098.1 hypothetical protein EV207_11876 [Scopulibacillus darangshiensis]